MLIYRKGFNLLKLTAVLLAAVFLFNQCAYGVEAGMGCYSGPWSAGIGGIPVGDPPSPIHFDSLLGCGGQAVLVSPAETLTQLTASQPPNANSYCSPAGIGGGPSLLAVKCPAGNTPKPAIAREGFTLRTKKTELCGFYEFLFHEIRN